MSTFTDKAKAVIAAVAPTVGVALGGPFAPLAGVLVAKALGKDGQPAPEAAISAAIASGDPEMLLKLKQAENDLLRQMGELGIKRDQLAYDDRANARAREIAVRDRTPAQLAWLVIGGFIGISAAQVAALMGWGEQVANIPPEGWLLIGNISGYLANEAKQAGAYYFGSSAGSKEKDATLAAVVTPK